MASTIANMTKSELQKLIRSAVENAVEQKLQEMLGDPDEGLQLRAKIRQRLLRQEKAARNGERGSSLDDVKKRLELE